MRAKSEMNIIHCDDLPEPPTWVKTALVVFVIIALLWLLAGCANVRLHHMSNSELQLRRYQLATRLSSSSDENWSDDLDEKESVEREMMRRGLRFPPVPKMASSHPVSDGVGRRLLGGLQNSGGYIPPGVFGGNVPQVPMLPVQPMDSRPNWRPAGFPPPPNIYVVPYYGY